MVSCRCSTLAFWRVRWLDHTFVPAQVVVVKTDDPNQQQQQQQQHLSRIHINVLWGSEHQRCSPCYTTLLHLLPPRRELQRIGCKVACRQRTTFAATSKLVAFSPFSFFFSFLSLASDSRAAVMPPRPLQCYTGFQYVVRYRTAPFFFLGAACMPATRILSSGAMAAAMGSCGGGSCSSSCS